MQRLFSVAIDSLLVGTATFASLAIRNDFELSAEQLAYFFPYLAITILVALLVNPLFGLDRAVWRFTTMADYLRVLAAAVATVAGAVALGFWLNRLEGIARALPILQIVLIVFLLVGVRVVYRLHHAASERRSQPMIIPVDHGETVLIVGAGTLTHLYLRSLSEFTPDQLHVAGILSLHSRHADRLMHRYPVLGVCEEVVDILRNLEIHGVMVTRILVTEKFAALSPAAQESLSDIERSSIIRVDYLAERLGFDLRNTPSSFTSASAEGKSKPLFAVGDLVMNRQHPYWRSKRAFDATVAFAVLAVVAPLIVSAALLVALDVGFPVVFWQRRPGLGGRPFKLFKLRTMRAAHDENGRRLSDAERLSALGAFLRRTRLDELPQLYHILVGDMSFVGPRPLLPVDQPAEYMARLLVRPGLTGWAQVKGGRLVSASDKAALDVWYVRNASLALDLKIILATVPMVLFGERTNRAAVEQAWRELIEAGVCSRNKCPEFEL